MTNQDAFAQPGAAERLAGGLSRVAAVSAERVDRDFERSENSPARFAIARRMDVAQAGRTLVASGSLSPSDVRVLAMQQQTDRSAVEVMTSPEGLRDQTVEASNALSGMNVGREGKAALHGLRRSLKAHDSGAVRLSHGGVADAFGRIATSAAETGSEEARKLASKTFASCAQAGVEVARARSRDRGRTDDSR